MGNHGVINVPPKQFTKLKKKNPHLSSREIKVKWARIQKATRSPNFNLRNKLAGMTGPNKDINFTRANDIHHSETYPRFTPTIPTYVSSFQDYNNPMPSTSTWPYDTVPYKSVVIERDVQKLESPTPKEPYRQHQILSNSYEVDVSPDTSGSYYSPETEPVSPCGSGAEASDMLSHCMKEANLGPQTDTEPVVELPVVSAPVKPIAPVVPVAKVAPVPIALEQVEPIVAPIVSPPQVVYNMANDPEIEVLMEVEAPAPVEPQPPVVEDL